MWPHPNAYLHHKKTSVVCTECGNNFIYGHKPCTKATFCSSLCRMRRWNKNNRKHISEYNKHRRQTALRHCKFCGGDIPKERRKSGVQFCSVGCCTKNNRQNSNLMRRERRLRVLGMIGPLQCVYCGCNTIGALEINHKNGGGCKENKGAGSVTVNNVYFGRRKTDDLEIVCRVCNAWHYISRKIGEDRWKITWS